jgi:hypothetical protein
MVLGRSAGLGWEHGSEEGGLYLIITGKITKVEQSTGNWGHAHHAYLPGLHKQ